MDDSHPSRDTLRHYLAAKRQAEYAGLDFPSDESQAAIQEHLEK